MTVKGARGAMRLNLLDGFDLRTDGGERLALTSKKARALLAFLACPPGKVHGRERLATLLWSSSPDAQARASLRQAVAAIRRILPDVMTEPRPGEADSLAVDPAALQVDVTAFEAADPADDAEADRAIDLYAGDFLGDLIVGEADFDNWASMERQRLRDRAITMMTGRLASLADSRDGQREAVVAQRLLTIDPLNEAAARAMMRLAVRQGRRGAALQTYRQIRDLLRQELAVAPEPETQALAQEIESGRRQQPPPSAGTPVEADRPDTEGTPAPATPAGPSLRQLAILVVALRGDVQRASMEDRHRAQAELSDMTARLAGSSGGRWFSGGGTTTVVLFGAQQASDTDAGRALRMAVDLKSAAGRAAMPIAPSIAIAGGLALVATGDGGDSVTGVPMDDALRLAMHADPGEILITDTVRRDTRLNLHAEPAGTNIWRVLELVNASGADDRHFVGRRGELRQWDAILTDCLEVGTGMTVLLSGDAGIGKSRLAQEFGRLARLRGYATHVAPVYDFGIGTGRDAMRLLLRSLLGLPPDARRRLRLAAADAAIPAGSVARAGLHDLLNLPLPRDTGPDYSAMDEDDRMSVKQAVSTDLVQRFARQQPRVLVVEDIHWADPRLMTYLAGLARVVEDCPALLVLTGRTGSDLLDQRWRTSAQEPTVVTLTLRPFRPSEALDFAALVAGSITETVTRCLDRAGGNPLFLEQLLLAGDTLADTGVPGSVQSLVLARLDGLDPETQRIAGAAAVLGLQVDPEALAHVAGAPDTAAGSLIDAALLRQQGRILVFSHPLIRDAVYSSLLDSQRRVMHARAAEWFRARDPAIHAQHLARADDPAAKQAFLNAAEAAATVPRFRLALRMLDEGLALPGDAAADATLLALKGELLLETGEVGEAMKAFDGALTVAGQGPARCRARLGLAETMRVLDRYDDAMAVLDRTANDCAVDDYPLQARIALLRGAIHFPRGELDDCLRANREAAALAARLGSPILEARAASGLGDGHYVSGQIRGALEAFERCVRLSQRNGLVQIEAVNRAMLGITRFYNLDIEAGLVDGRAALEAALRIRSARSAMLAGNVVSLMLMYVGDLQEARDLAEAAADRARDLGARRFVSEAEAYAAFLAFASDNDADVGERIARSSRAAEMHGLSYAGPMILAFQAATTPDMDTRAAALAKGDALLRTGSCVSHNYLHFYQMAIDMALADTDWNAARGYADALASDTSVEPIPWADLVIDRGLALAAAQGSPAATADWHARVEATGLVFPKMRPAARQTVA